MIIRRFVFWSRRGSAFGAFQRFILNDVPSNSAQFAHLDSVDAERWPSLVYIPSAAGMRIRARMAEAKFAKHCAQAGLELSPDGEHDLVVDHAQLFDRIALKGWVGFAEGYMAGEWRTDTSSDLVKVLKGLLVSGYSPKTPHMKQDPKLVSGEIPPELVARYGGDGMSAFAGHFSTGVPTTERMSRKSFVPAAGRGKEPSNYFVATTHFAAPLETMKHDLGDAQARSVSMLLDEAGVRAGTQVAEIPCSGGAVAIAAASRRATVDAVVTDSAVLRTLRERLTLAGVADSVHISVTEDPSQTLMRRAGRYDAIVCAEYFETLPQLERRTRLQLADKLLAKNGRAVIQSVTATEKLSGPARDAMESLRAYIWPSLEYSDSDELRRIADKYTGLRVVGETHAPDHLALSLKHQLTTFQGQLREAAADGFDAVYRRLWMWQLALRQAMAELGMLDVVQYTLTHRHRWGVR